MSSKGDLKKANLEAGRDEEKDAEEFEWELEVLNFAKLVEKVFGKDETVH